MKSQYIYVKNFKDVIYFYVLGFIFLTLPALQIWSASDEQTLQKWFALEGALLFCLILWSIASVGCAFRGIQAWVIATLGWRSLVSSKAVSYEG